MTLRTPTFLEVQTWKLQIVNEAVDWVTGVNGITDENLIEAYRAGVEHGARKMLSTLRFQSAIGPYDAKR